MLLNHYLGVKITSDIDSHSWDLLMTGFRVQPSVQAILHHHDQQVQLTKTPLMSKKKEAGQPEMTKIKCLT